jgi:hypothetical protein
MIVKNRDGQFILSSIISSQLQEQVQTVFDRARRTSGVFNCAFSEHKRLIGSPNPLFLTVAGGPC